MELLSLGWQRKAATDEYSQDGGQTWLRHEVARGAAGLALPEPPPEVARPAITELLTEIRDILRRIEKQLGRSGGVAG